MSASPASKRPSRRAEPAWTKLSERDLLKVRLKDLGLSLRGTWIEDCVEALNDELAARGILARPHAWLSDEWFSPSDTPGISVPFYLAHPRLMRLERKMMHEVEGGARRDCMRFLRHEAGHVVQHAYALHRRKRWQTLFGLSSLPYPEHYRPNPASRNYVQHLRRWYAQSHPDEDFAETFAVWLTPRAAWRKRYEAWPALEKLDYVDELMAEIAGQKPALTKRTSVDPLSTLTKTLGEHYRRKLEHYAIDAPTIFDRDLKRIFSDDPADAKAPLAASFIKRNRVELRRLAGDAYEVAREAAFDDMIDRCRVLKLRAAGSARQMRQALATLAVSKAVLTHYGTGRRQWFAV